MKTPVFILTLLLGSLVGLCSAEPGPPLLLQKPTLSKDSIVFVFAGDLWVVARQGGDASRLTSGVGVETRPCFSPDGSLVAFSGEYDGNLDAYVIPATGGVPRRLTSHPDPDVVIGWTPDGKQILFRSVRHFFNRLFTVPLEGGFPTELPLPMAEEGSLSPDASHLAYLSRVHFQRAWKRYRGGQTGAIWIADLADSSIEKVPRDNSNDVNPMWVGNRIYFLSDRNGPVTLFSYDLSSKQVSQVLGNDGLDIKSASAGPGAIVYEQFGSLHLFDLASSRASEVPVRLAGDLPEVRPRFLKVETKNIRAAGISPTGVRAVFQAHGEILTVPAEKGDARNLTRSPAVADRDPAWSPDGKWIAHFSDESGEYALHLREQTGLGEVRKIELGSPPSFFYSPVWSPDSKKIAYTDKRLQVWYVDLDERAPVCVDTNTYDTPFHLMTPAWSPDSRWLAYAKQLRNHLHAIFIYSFETAKSIQVTDGMSDAVHPVFDKTGKYLYFAASTDVGLTTAWLDMSSIDHPLSRSVYVIVLTKDLPSPLAPESDEEKKDSGKEKQKENDKKLTGKDESVDESKDKEKDKDKESKEKEAKETKDKEPVVVRIDFEGISQRILALPLPAKNYRDLAVGKTNLLFLAEGPDVELSSTREDDLEMTVQKFDLATRKSEKLVEGVKAFEVSFNGEKMLYHKGDQWFISATGSVPKAGEGALKFDTAEVYFDPPAVWRQIYHEAWRIQRDFLYDPGHHGLDLQEAAKKYEPYLERLSSRADLNYLFEEMLGELTLGHTYIGGGEMPEPKRVKVGLLGADYKIENGRYRFARIFSGENWNPKLRAPLTQPGVNVTAGEYLLAVNGQDVRGADEVYSYFRALADRQVVLRVGPNPDGSGAREVTVVAVDNERQLRNRAWIEDNRRQVDEMSQGKLAYVYLPNTAAAGYQNFNRYYFGQVGKEGAVIDERFNGGGDAADYIIDYLRRPLLSFWTTREGEDFTTPLNAIFGPKVMIINESAGSGGDALPWYFRRMKIGPLIGKRTWGGLVGIYDYPELIDGGRVTAPRLAFYSPDGLWDVENKGVAPDIEVELEPKAWRLGHDLQLEKAVEVALAELKNNPLPKPKKPAYPNYHLHK